MQPSFSRPVEQNHGIKMKKTCTKEHQVLGKGGNMPCQLSLFLGSSHVIPYIFGWLFVNTHFDILFPFQWMNLIYVKTFWVQQKLISIETLKKANTGFASIFLTQDCSGKHTLFDLHISINLLVLWKNDHFEIHKIIVTVVLPLLLSGQLNSDFDKSILSKRILLKVR